MGDSLEARISIVEQIQEEFGHDLQGIKGHLVRLIDLIEGHTEATSENTYGSPSLPLQSRLPHFIYQRHPGHESWIPVRGNVPQRIHHPNWRPHAPTSAIIPACGKVSQLVDPANNSWSNFGKSKRNRDKSRWDPILVTYTELLPRLLERQLVTLSSVLPRKPPFPKSHNPNVYCDYHMGNPGHSTEDCRSLKQQVQTFIEVGKINFKSSNQLSHLLPNFSETKTEKAKEFATTSEGIHGKKTGSTSEKTEEEKKASELQKENEKLRRLVQDMAYMMTEQKESIAALRGGM